VALDRADGIQFRRLVILGTLTGSFLSSRNMWFHFIVRLGTRKLSASFSTLAHTPGSR
jgi:hypothetical protein